MIYLENVCKTYSSGIPALNDVSLHIERGEFVFIVGASGSGKSTLIKSKLPYLRRDIGVVFQDFRLFDDRNVYENIAFAQKAIEAPSKRIRAKVLAMLSMVGLLDKYKTNPKQLSGGEQQRVAIARALINKPEILLADEPTGNLDENNSWEIMKLLENANEQGTTVVVVTHNMEIVRAMRKRTIAISEGSVAYDIEEGGNIYEV